MTKSAIVTLTYCQQRGDATKELEQALPAAVVHQARHVIELGTLGVAQRCVAAVWGASSCHSVRDVGLYRRGVVHGGIGGECVPQAVHHGSLHVCFALVSCTVFQHSVLLPSDS